MASRTFGGTIKLTGEDEYRKALSNIRENLSVVSSELKVVTSSFDKNNASVKNLSDTNDVLIKKLDSQKQKLEVLKKALADAEEETGSNSSTTMKWQTELNKAQAEVNKTTLEIQKNVQQMKDLEEQSKKTSNEVNKLSGNFKDTGDSSKKFGDIVKGNVVADFIVEGIKTIASEVIEMGKAFLEIGNTVQKSSNQMKASLGLTNEEAKEYDKIMKDIYNNNYGDSFEDVATKIGYVRQATGEIDPSKIEELTTNAIALEDTFGSDFNETIRGVSNLMTTFCVFHRKKPLIYSQKVVKKVLIILLNWVIMSLNMGVILHKLDILHKNTSNYQKMVLKTVLINLIKKMIVLMKSRIVWAMELLKIIYHYLVKILKQLLRIGKKAKVR